MPPQSGREPEAGPSQRGPRLCGVNSQSSACDLRPGPLPGVVVHAVLLAVAAVGNGRLPEMDLLVVRQRLVEVVFGTRTGLDLVHERAGLRVHGRLTEDERLLGLDLWRRGVLHPQVRTVRVLRLLGEHPGVGQEGDRKSTRLNSSHVEISYAVFCLKKKKQTQQ